ncbi:tRNA (mnm(5)s(2)U34)-methyltransferase [Streptococcus pluranimalium]
MKRPLEMSHDFLMDILDDKSVVLDATMGNGHDTAFFAQRVKWVYAFDIQEQAVLATKERLKAQQLGNVDIILDGHEKLDHYIDEPLDAAIFNLGYLPKADKRVVTKPHTTLESLSKALTALKDKGRIAVMIYYGHEGGEMEKDAVLNFVKQLNQKKYTVMLYQTLNQINTPPFLIMIEKRTSS